MHGKQENRHVEVVSKQQDTRSLARMAGCSLFSGYASSLSSGKGRKERRGHLRRKFLEYAHGPGDVTVA